MRESLYYKQYLFFDRVGFGKRYKFSYSGFESDNIEDIYKEIDNFIDEYGPYSFYNCMASYRWNSGFKAISKIDNNGNMLILKKYLDKYPMLLRELKYMGGIFTVYDETNLNDVLL